MAIVRSHADAQANKRLERTRHEQASLVSSVGEPLKRRRSTLRSIQHYLQGQLSMRTTFVIAVLVLTTASIGLGQKQSARRAPKSRVDQVIRQVDHERIQAQIGGDAAALDRIYADDFIGIGPSGTARTKAQVIADFTSGDLKFQSIITDDVQVRVYGNAAVETGRSTMIGQDKGKTVPRDNRFTRVWIKQGAHWRLVANHYSSLITP
jgi:ketosteroid isomerase-like protein